MVTLETLDKKFDQKFDLMNRKIDAMDHKFEVKLMDMESKIEEKIDDLAAMTARGFAEIRWDLNVRSEI